MSYAVLSGPGEMVGETNLWITAGTGGVTVVATKALACKLAKAAWHVATQGVDYDPGRMFPELLPNQTKGNP